jgi:hypothetical protein
MDADERVWSNAVLSKGESGIVQVGEGEVKVYVTIA